MVAIVTTKFRYLNAENIIATIADASTNVYLGICKSDAWSGSTSDLTDDLISAGNYNPGDTIDDINLAYQNMMGMKITLGSDASHVIPRYDWEYGMTDLVAWDSGDSAIYDKKFYVLTDEFKVYKLLKIVDGSGPSTEQPTATSTAAFDGGDGYVWKYMYSLGVLEAEKHLTRSYMPVKTISFINPNTQVEYTSDAEAESVLSEADFAKYLNQKASRDYAGAGRIENIIVTNGGTAYSSAPAVTITGDGTGATATATVGGSVVTAITITDPGSDYTITDITFSGGGGSDATARAVVAPGKGHGIDPVREMGGFFVSINVQLEGEDAADCLVIDNDFRQIVLIQDPLENDGVTYAADTTYRTLKALNVADTTGFQTDELLVGQTSGAQAYLDQIDSVNNILYYHQNNKTGFVSFVNSETVTGQISNETETIVSQTDSPIQYASGQVLFLENRDPINRAATQIEDIKLIIEF